MRRTASRLPIGEDVRRMPPLNRIAWSVTVGACVVLVVLLLLAGYQGYGAVTFAVGLSAAINLR